MGKETLVEKLYGDYVVGNKLIKAASVLNDRQFNQYNGKVIYTTFFSTKEKAYLLLLSPLKGGGYGVKVIEAHALNIYGETADFHIVNEEEKKKLEVDYNKYLFKIFSKT